MNELKYVNARHAHPCACPQPSPPQFSPLSVGPPLGVPLHVCWCSRHILFASLRTTARRQPRRGSGGLRQTGGLARESYHRRRDISRRSSRLGEVVAAAGWSSSRTPPMPRESGRYCFGRCDTALYTRRSIGDIVEDPIC